MSNSKLFDTLASIKLAGKFRDLIQSIKRKFDSDHNLAENVWSPSIKSLFW